MLTDLGGMLASGAFRPVVDRTYPLDRILEAYRYVETGRKVGSVVVCVASAGDAGDTGDEGTGQGHEAEDRQRGDLR